MMPLQLGHLEHAPLRDGIQTLVAALEKRGVPLHDAEEAVQDTLCWFWEQPDYQHYVAELEKHRGLFIKASMNRWLMRLRSERARRQREALYVDADPDRGTGAGVSDPAELFFGASIERSVALRSLLAFADNAKLTARQVHYLQQVVAGKSVKEIAAETATTTRAVNAVLARAAKKFGSLVRT